MNIQTLKKLAQNPHYKLNDKQKAELAQATRKPMVTFGVINKHDNTKKIHSTGQRKKKVKGK